jgi:AraC-like DNA-binding protein
MYLFSVNDVGNRLLASLDKILTNDFPKVNKYQIGLESNTDRIQWWASSQSYPLTVFTKIVSTISKKYIDDIALRVADLAQLTDLGMMGYAMLTSTNLENAIRIACNALDEANYPIVVALNTKENHSELEFTVRKSDKGNINQEIILLEIGMLSAWRYCQSIIYNGSHITPEEVHMPNNFESKIESYTTRFNCSVLASTDRNLIKFDSKLLRCKIPTGNTQRLIDCNNHIYRLLSTKLPRNNRLSDRVRNTLHENTDECTFNLQATAQTLNMSRNQLRRELSKTNDSFRKIATDVRMELARRYLISSPFSVKQIAYQLNYRQPNNFIRAFSSQHKCSPTAYRKDHQITADN